MIEIGTNILPRDSSGSPLHGFDLSERVSKKALYVWNPITLDWERMRQPMLELTGDLTVTMGDVEALLSDSYWKRMKPHNYLSGRPKYLCKNTDIDADETDTDWRIWKYSDADLPTIEGPRVGAVNTEAAINGLSWVT